MNLSKMVFALLVKLVFQEVATKIPALKPPCCGSQGRIKDAVVTNRS